MGGMELKYSKATDYALHTMLLLAASADQQPVSVVDLAKAQNISPTYLSKILTRLSKEGLIKGATGANGGYTIAKQWEQISFFQIIQAIEGKESIFESYVHDDPKCTVKETMFHAEALMEHYLKKQTLGKIIK